MRITLWISLILVTALVAPNLHAQGWVPDSVDYQGRLVDTQGDPVDNGNYEMEFTIYDQNTGGSPIWGPIVFDGQAITGHRPQVPVVDGNYDVALGPEDTTSRRLSAAFNGTQTDNGSRFLEIKVEGEAIGSRQQLLSTPFSYAAGGMIPIGGIIAHHLSLPGAASLAALRQAGFALCDGDTAAGQGITDAVITGTLPNLNVGDGNGRFLRGTTDATGATQDDQIQGHSHEVPGHTHPATSHPHFHSTTTGSHSHSITTGEGDGGDRDLAADGDTGGGTHIAVTDSAAAEITALGETTITVNINDASLSIGDPTTDGVNGTPRIGNETRPKSMTIAWIIRVR